MNVNLKILESVFLNEHEETKIIYLKFHNGKTTIITNGENNNNIWKYEIESEKITEKELEGIKNNGNI